MGSSQLFRALTGQPDDDRTGAFEGLHLGTVQSVTPLQVVLDDFDPSYFFGPALSFVGSLYVAGDRVAVMFVGDKADPLILGAIA